MSKTSNNTLIECKNIVFGYTPKDTILNDVSFSLKKNEYVCIVGANGCGKSTLGKIIVGLLKPRSGSIILNNEVITNYVNMPYNLNNLQKLLNLYLSKKDTLKPLPKLIDGEEIMQMFNLYHETHLSLFVRLFMRTK